MSAKTITHPQIGGVAGVHHDGVTQFRGVKYATLKDRFSPAELMQYDGTGLDATKYGCVQTDKPRGPSFVIMSFLIP